jgi:ribosome-interacting GTPase 1
MAANLSAQFINAEKRYKAATTMAEKIDALEEMFREIPKHKGTEKMQADIKKKISQAKKEANKAGPGKGGYAGPVVKKSGDAQVVIIGAPNAGKSLMVDNLTNAEPEVAEFPFTTRIPTPGMMMHLDVQIQLVDLPPIAEGYIENWLPQIIRYADAALLVLSCRNDDILTQYEDIINILREYKIELCQERPPEEERERGIAYLPTIMVANKMDTDGAEDILEIFQEFFGQPFDLIKLDATDEESLMQIPHKLFDHFKLVRIYAKEPGKPVSKERPFVFRQGATLYELAREIHKDIAESLKVAKVWGEGKFDGQLVNRDYILEDKDIIELHF